MIPVPTTKRCSKCGRDLPFSEFYFSLPRGYNNCCKRCHIKAAHDNYVRKKGYEVKSFHRYTAEEDAAITTNLDKTYKEIGKMINRSEHSVFLRSRTLGYRKYKKKEGE